MDAATTSPKAAPTLPPECIEMILQYLWDDPSTLHQLSLCSRTLFNLIIPILYKSPFRLIADHRTWSDASKSLRTARLIRLLYACSVTPSSSLKGDADPMSSSELPVTPLTGDVLFKGPADWPELPSPLTTDYLFHYTHQGQIPKFFRAFQVLSPSRSSYGSAPHASKTLALALFGHSPGRIQTLSMTAHQLGCVLFDEPGQGISWKEGVGLGSLRMLRRLELDITATHTSTSWRNARGQGEWASNQNPTAEADFPLIFIQEHQRLFRQSPVDHFSNPTTTTGSSNEPLPPPVLQELVIRGPHGEWTPAQLLSKIEPLEVVDLSAWNAGVPALDQIPQQRLKSFRTNIARRLESVQVPLEYLRRCSQLEEIWMSTQGANAFRWAIDLNRSIGDYVSEARLRRRRGQVTHSPALAEAQDQGMVGHDVVNTTTTAAAAVPPSSSAQSDDASLALLPVPPLTKIRLYGGPRDLIPSLEDALDAFRDNIEELSGFEDGYSRREEYPRMQITWSVPNLSYLDLQGRFVFFFDLRCLRHCPGLRTLKLHIESNIAAPHRRRGNVDVNDDQQDGQDVQDGEDPVWMTGRDYSVIAELSRLEELQLRGTSWNINNGTLQTLGGFSLATADYDHPDLVINETEYRPTPLAGSLKYFGMTEAHLPSRAALVPFVATMTKLKVISLGTTYSFAIGSLQEAAGPRLTVECTNSSVY
ncbi:hypothetical protein KI688_011903 [Linnemannia hyalina]|uniref:Uncharacterized protein n=1 Tax=Linnemannia hyalina TaxID=64524 RepID=A0A9P8BVP2_9FUNG|nr:hypothetical protein KI688_011903 [Linnemannia hyalina]